MTQSGRRISFSGPPLHGSVPESLAFLCRMSAGRIDSARRPSVPGWQHPFRRLAESIPLCPAILVNKPQRLTHVASAFDCEDKRENERAMEQQFTTSDYGVIVALQMHGIYPVEQIITDRSRNRFVFAESPDARRIVADYQSGRLQGSLIAFRSLLTTLMKSLKRVESQQ
jgi:hypothetical protein